MLVIFKARSIYLLTGHDADTFALQKVTDSMGAVSHASIVQVGNDLLFLSTGGISSLTTATLQGNLATGEVSQKLAAQMNRLNESALKNAFAVHLPSRNEVWWFVPEGSALENKRVLVYHLDDRKGRWSRRSGIVARCGMAVQQTLYTGGYDGHIQRQLYGNSYDGQPLTWQYRTPFYPLGQPSIRKRIREVEVFLTQLANATFNIKAAWDQMRSEARRQVRFITVNLNTQSVLYGSAVYGEDRYDAAGLYRKRLVLPGSGHSFQLEFTGSQTLKPVELQGWSITTIEGGD